MARNGNAEDVHSRLRGTISEPERLLFEPLIADIERLKLERNAVIRWSDRIPTS